ncbi:Response regulator receiver domain-containing protein [Desulfonatronum thiosulfatophilum]|uniref:Response regulator receiver domain-containing protein n=1 Tax=Desulfonatronum thiosulfatophilum TaxID=617002 RepID=A0A1G6AXQ1_9BACT|nr:response regulator [Desulfonatronum thiosulfatophilum]SDB13013.1 Response regulator receiver domain-containing protein [Desulfonatronum thiosulfatophilum]
MDKWNHDEEPEDLNVSILLIESDIEQGRSMELELRRSGFKVFTATSHLRALSLLEDHKNLRIVLVQVEATDIGGFDFVHLLRHRNRFQNQHLQIIMIGSGEDFVRFPADGNSIDDYLLRPYFPGELCWRVRKAQKFLLNQKQIAAVHQMSISAGILTSSGLKRALHEELNKAFRKRSCFSLAVFELYGLESVHLNHGLMMAEWMERDLSAQIRDRLRSYDRLGRLDWGRYCLIAPEIDQEHLRLLLIRFSRQIAEWNESVSRNSHIRIPLEPQVRPLTVIPEFEPHHLAQATAVLWDWIIRLDGHVPVAAADYSSIVITSETIADVVIAEQDGSVQTRLAIKAPGITQPLPQ